MPEPLEVQGGSYLADHPEFYRNTSVTNFRAPDEGMRDRDILEMVIPGARERGMKVIPELMEPLFKYAGHGSANTVQIPNLVQYMEVDYLGRIGGAPCLENPDYRTWWHALIEDHCRSYDIDGIMWCNERRSPLDQLVTGMAPGCFCRHCLTSMGAGGVDAEAARRACSLLHNYFKRARAGERFTDGALITGLRVLLENPSFCCWSGTGSGATRIWTASCTGSSSGAIRRSSSGSTFGTATTSTLSARRSGRGPRRRTTPTGSSRSRISTSPAGSTWAR